ncbi:thiol-disulfide isomerase/thioredoxin [Paraburkholderia sp. GAS199]|uniref:thioredoxin family protein n=1 Tax=Paraburkholderia sp. GAS199 TaxID=3035126 RepID=UPI003D25C1B2
MFDRLKMTVVVAGVVGSALIASLAYSDNSFQRTASLQTGASQPDFKGIDGWLNSAPLDQKQLRGKVVLVDFWTFDCINCAHTLPYVKDWYARYRDKGLVVVGVHTPEYSFERDTGNLRNAVKRFGIEYPVAEDNHYATWDAYGNLYWPALYLFDQNGKLVYSHFGEGSYAQTEDRIRGLLGLGGKQG